MEAGHGTLGHGHVTQALVTGAALGRQRGQDAHIRAHGLEMFVLGGQILDQRAAHGIHRRRGQLPALQPGVDAPGCQQAAGGALHIALKAGDLARKEHIGVRLQEQARVQHTGRIQKGIAVHDTVPHELGIFQARDHAEHPLLLAPLEVGLEAHDIIEGAFLILGAELDIGPGAVAGVGVHQTHRAQGAEAHGISTSGSHDLDGHTALVDCDGIRFFAVGIGVGLGPLFRTGIEGMERGTLCRSQLGVESLILCLIEGAVQVIGLAPVVPGSGEHLVVIQALGRDDRSHGIIEMEPLIAGQAADLVGQRTIGQGAGGHQNGCTLIDVLHLLPHHGDVGALLHPPGHGGAECIPVHGQCAARGHTGLLGGFQQLAAHPAHLLFQQAGSRIQTLGLQAVGADQLRKARALVSRGKVGGLLLVERYLNALARQPQCRLAACQTGTQYSNFIVAHVVSLYLISHFQQSGKTFRPAKGSPTRGAGNAKH